MVPYHQFGGAVVYVWGMATCALGLAEKQGFINGSDKFSSSAMMAGTIALFVLLTAIFTVAHQFDFRPANAKRDGNQTLLHPADA